MSARFHPLDVTRVQKTTPDAVEVTLAPRAGDFGFRPGQYLTFRQVIDGVELRRSYSICSGPGEALKVGIKRVAGGAFSTWANTDLAPGTVLEAMPPAGRFGDGLATTAAHTLFFAGGSGITPILSMMRHVLLSHPAAQVTLVYANRAVSTIMFREEIEDLKNRHMDQLNVIHVLEQDGHEIDLFHGRLTPDKCHRLLSDWIDMDGIAASFICGPGPMMDTVRQALTDFGEDEGNIHIERFQGTQEGRLPKRARMSDTGPSHVPLTITLDGVARQVDLPRDISVLEAGLRAGLDMPYACRAGVCSTCKCKVVAGAVEMVANHALEEYEIAAGYVLSCQSYAQSDRVTVDYDQ